MKKTETGAKIIVDLSIEFPAGMKDFLVELTKSITPEAAKKEPTNTPAKKAMKQLDLFDEKKSDMSLTQIRELITEKAGRGDTAAVVEALKKYGAKNASGLDASNYEAFYNDLKNI